jgi:hypothetical protein
MKTKLAIILIAAFSVLTGHAQFQLVDTTTAHVVGGQIIYGDPLPTAFAKVNSNFTYCAAQLAFLNTECANIVGLQAGLQATNAVFSNNFVSVINMVTNLNGKWIQGGTINSNSLDSGTMAWLNSHSISGSGGGGDGSGEMDFDGGAIISDGNGDIWANAIVVPSIWDSQNLTGSAGQVATANGDRTWSWEAPSGGGAATIVFTNTITGAPGTMAIVTNVGNNVSAVLQLTIPAGAPGAPGTNTVTVYNLSNAWLGCRLLPTYTTNYAMWNASNFLARVPGFYRGRASGGDDGGNPPESIPISFVGSFTGTNNWFVITNGFQTTNTISVALITNGASMRGGTIVDPGSATLYNVDHWELVGVTNYGFAEHYQFDTPVNPNDAATKGYCDGLYANAFDSNFSSYTNNGVTYTVYSYQNAVTFQIANQTVNIPHSFAIDGTGTNILFGLTLASMTNGCTLQYSTNLAQVAGWMTFTNYTSTTNAGVVTFTIPMNRSLPLMLFRAIASATSIPSFLVPLGVPEIAFATNTITHSTNSTYGYGAGLMTCDTNYVYVSVGTNAWCRLAIPTNTW